MTVLGELFTRLCPASASKLRPQDDTEKCA